MFGKPTRHPSRSNKDFKKAIQDLSEKVSQLSEEKGRLNSENHHLQRQISQLESEVFTKTNRIQSLQNDLNDLDEVLYDGLGFNSEAFLSLEDSVFRKKAATLLGVLAKDDLKQKIDVEFNCEELVSMENEEKDQLISGFPNSPDCNNKDFTHHLGYIFTVMKFFFSQKKTQ